MQFIRRRYYVWLIKAYFKRWSKTIISSLVIGSVLFFTLFLLMNAYILPRLQRKVQKIGYSGAYDLNSIPKDILQDVSYGLTDIDENNSVKPKAAYKWQIKDEGKEYIMYIKKGQYFHNNKELTAENLPVSFKDVEKRIIDNYTVSFRLREAYSPFLTSLAAPIITDDIKGLGDYIITKADVNSGFVRSLTLVNRSDPSFKKIIRFYPSDEALRTAYALGEIDTAKGLKSTALKETNLEHFKNTKVTKSVNYNKLVTAFYNNSDKTLSNKKVRQALNYAVPRVFDEGERAFSPIPPVSLYFTKTPNYGIADLNIAKELLEDEKEARDTIFEIAVLEGYERTAIKLQDSWKKIGIKSKIKTVASLPQRFQILIYPMNLPRDPDQYTLWHSGEVNNISGYKNLRIDKILEDGRLIYDRERRVGIYQNFQKYLIDDTPASFLYFPYEYQAVRN